MSVAIRTAIRRTRASELGGLAGDSFYVAAWQGAITVADLVQIALVTHVLGLHQYGRLALVMSFVILVGQFFDVRIGAAATTFGARRLHARDVDGAAGAFQLAYLVDVGTGVVAFGLVAALAPLAGPRLVGGNGALLVLLFALTLLISTADESSVTVLRLLDRFKLIALYTAGLQAVRIALVAVAVFAWHSLFGVLLALVVADLLAAFANALAAVLVFRRWAGTSLTKPALRRFKAKRQMLRMAFHTNVVSYARLAQVQFPTLLVGVLSGATPAGVYKIGTAGAAAIGRLADPAYGAVLPRVSRLWAEGRREEIRHLARRCSVVAGVVLGAAFLVLVLLRVPVLHLIGGHGAAAGSTVLVLAAAAQLVNGLVFWNVGLLFAAGRSGSVALIAVASAIVQVGFLVPLVIVYGASGAAAALLMSTLVSNIIATLLSMRVLASPEPALAQHREEAACAE